MKKFILSIIGVIGCYFSAMSQDVSGAYDLETAVQNTEVSALYEQQSKKGYGKLASTK